MTGTEPQQGDDTVNGTAFDDVPLTPPADCIKITEDGGVLKHVVAEGSGDLPVRHGRCLGKRFCSSAAVPTASSFTDGLCRCCVYPHLLPGWHSDSSAGFVLLLLALQCTMLAAVYPAARCS